MIIFRFAAIDADIASGALLAAVTPRARVDTLGCLRRRCCLIEGGYFMVDMRAYVYTLSPMSLLMPWRWRVFVYVATIYAMLI